MGILDELHGGEERMNLPLYLFRKYGEHAVDAYFASRAIDKPPEIALMWALHFGRNYQPGTGTFEALIEPDLLSD